MKKTLLLAIGAALIIGPAHAQMKLKKGARKGVTKKKTKSKGPNNLTIKDVTITKVNRNEVELSLKLHKPGQGQARHKVRVEFVDGKRVYRLWEKDAKFSAGRDGFVNAATIDIRNKNLRRGEVVVTVVECATRPKCKHTIKLNKGDLLFKGRPETERRGSQTILRLEVTNRGPVKAGKCKAVIKIDGRKVKEIPVNGLAVGASKKVEVRYDNNKKRKPYVAELKCNDLADNNNLKRGKLK